MWEGTHQGPQQQGSRLVAFRVMLGILVDLFAKMTFLHDADVSRQASQNTRAPSFQCLASQRDAGLADLPYSISILGVKAIKKWAWFFVAVVLFCCCCF